jgi:hypothetical protein
MFWHALRRRGQTLKQESQHADQRDRRGVKEKGRWFRRKVKWFEPGRLQFVDESGVNTAMARTRGWAPRGERPIGWAPFSVPRSDPMKTVA